MPVPLRTFICILITGILLSDAMSQNDDRKIHKLQWKNVSSRVFSDNLTLLLRRLDYESQKLSYTKSVAAFLPRISYSGSFVNNLELPVFVFQGQRIRVGADYNVQHSLQLNIPIFIGGSRWLQAGIQKNMSRSLESELAGSGQEEVFNALQTYFRIILTDSLRKAAQEAVDVARANLDQVRAFYEAGTATNLEFQRAKARYFSKLPQLESAVSDHKLARQQIKLQLNINLNDSVAIENELRKMSFLGNLSGATPDSLEVIAFRHRQDLMAIRHRGDAAQGREKISYSRFLPELTLNASVDHQAQVNSLDFSTEAYRRSKTLRLSARWQLFDAGQRYLDAQKAQISSKQAVIQTIQLKEQVAYQVKQAWLAYSEASENLSSLEQTIVQAGESLRLANAFYQEGVGSQLEVLDAQLLYTQSQIDYLRGIFDFNVSQLTLLKSIGRMDIIWE